MADAASALEAERRTVPASLLEALSHPQGGLVTIVIGAGTSLENPTGLPLAGDCSEDAYRRLVADTILDAASCATPRDLSAVADAVFEKTNGQGELVRRLPVSRFRLASPNDGHLIAAALLREGALASVLSLNFDRAMESALVAVGADDDIAVIRGPEDGAGFGSQNLVYLHRTVDHLPDEWILRTEALESAWSQAWEEAVAQRLLTTRAVAFVGLGSQAAVLTETIKKLRLMLGEDVTVVQADPGVFGSSEFTAALKVNEDFYVQLGWCDFMHVLSDRAQLEQIEVLRRECVAVLRERDDSGPNCTELLQQLTRLGLVSLGRMRARWMLSPSPYEPAKKHSPRYMAQVLTALAFAEHETSAQVHLGDDGVVEFWAGGELLGCWGVVCSAGRWRWGAVEARVEEYRSKWNVRRNPVRHVVVSGAAGVPRQNLTPPESILGSVQDDHLVYSADRLVFLSLELLDSDGDAVRKALSHGG